MKAALFSLVIFVQFHSFGQVQPNIDSSHLFGKWRITEIRGEGWSWDVNLWNMKYANDQVKVSADSIGNFPLPKPIDVQGVGFDLLATGKAIVYYQQGLSVHKSWWYKKAGNEVYINVGHHSSRHIKPFIEDRMLKLAMGRDPQTILERIN